MSGAQAGPTDPADWPQYCCAILRDVDGRYLLEKRPAHDADAPGRLICFGGGREPGEHPDACVRRELREELGLDAEKLRLCVVLRQGARVIAWFYQGTVEPGAVRAQEPGVEAVWARWDEFWRWPIGAWHLAALTAERGGEPAAEV